MKTLWFNLKRTDWTNTRWRSVSVGEFLAQPSNGLLSLPSLPQVTHVRMASCPPWCVPPCPPSRPRWPWSSSSRFPWTQPRRCASSQDSTRSVVHTTHSGRHRRFCTFKSLFFVLKSFCKYFAAHPNINICDNLYLSLLAATRRAADNNH